MNTSVIIADDHSLIRDGLKSILSRKAPDITVIGEASNGEEVLQLSSFSPAQLYILDIGMPVMNGLETASALLKLSPCPRIIILSMYDSREFVLKAISTGIHAYVLKDNASSEIVPAIREVFQKRFYLSPKISGLVVEGFLSRSPFSETQILTEREIQILKLIAAGLSTRQIAEKLFISENTVNTHKKSLMSKLDIHKQSDLVRYAIKEGLIQA